MIQVMYGEIGGNSNGGTLCPIFGGLNEPWPNHNRCPCPVDGTFRNLVVQDIAAGKTWTLYKNEVATALTCTTDGLFQGRDTTHSVTVAESDLLYWARTGGGFFEKCFLSVEFEPTDGVSAVYMSPQRPAGGAFGGAFAANQMSGASSPSGTTSLVAAAGNVTALSAVAYFNSLSALTGITFTLAKNGVLQDGSGGTPDTRVTILATAGTTNLTGFLDGFSVAVAVGDRIEVKQVAVGSPPSNTVGYGCRFEPTTAGQYSICGSNTGVGASSVPLYGTVPGSPNTWRAVEYANIGGITTINLTGLQNYNTSTPTDGVTLTMKLRRNATNPTNQPLIEIDHGETYVIDSDVTHIVSIADGDTWDTYAAVSSGTLAAAFHWSYQAAVPSEPGARLTIVKTTSPAGSADEFGFTATGDLSPLTFTLTDGQSQSYDDLDPGTYGIDETTIPTPWSLSSITVSNGDPPEAIVLESGDDVTVTFLNVQPIAPTVEIERRTIRRLRRAPHVSALGQRVFLHKLQVDLQPGVGLVQGQGADPQIMLRVSRDGGNTWGYERWMSAGAIGAYLRRVQWWRLGQSRDFVFELVVSDPVAWYLVAAWMDAETGLS